MSQGIGGRSQPAVTSATDVRLSRQGADPDFSKFNASLTFSQALPRGLQFTALARGQSSFNKPMMTAEELSLDGQDAVSAFAQSTLTVDEGGTLRGEVSRPVAWSSALTMLSPYVFGAAGAGWMMQATTAEQSWRRAEAAGFGIRTASSGRTGPLGGVLGLEVGRQFSNLENYHDHYRATLTAAFNF